MIRILFADDDEEFRTAHTQLLRRAGYAVIEARDGKEALELVLREPIDLVVTDIIMPEIEGLETISRLRRGSKSLPIIAISGGGRGTAKDYLQMAKRFGARATLAKPFSSTDLLQTIESLLQPPQTTSLSTS